MGEAPVSSPGSPRFGNASTSVVLGLLLGVALGGAGMYFWKSASGDSRGSPQSGVAVAKTKVSALGKIQPKGGVISIFGTAGDRIEKLAVKLDDKVGKDTILVELASRKDAELARNLAAKQHKEAKEQRAALEDAGKAKIAVIDAEIALLQSGRESDLKAHDAKIAALTYQNQVATDNWNRLKSLVSTKVAMQDLEKSELLSRQAESELTASRAIRDKTEKGYTQNEALLKAKRSAAIAEVEEALKRVPVDSLAENLKIAERRLEATQIKAPVAGQILKVIGHEGDTIGNQPILQLGDTSAMVVNAEVYETDVQQLDAWLKDGPSVVTITSRALDKPLNGELHPHQIARLIGKNQIFSLNPCEDIDRRVVEVLVDVKPDSVELASRYVGLEFQVEFQPCPKP
jgi:HlyD family secretion protein